MSREEHRLTPKDILPMAEYEPQRAQQRKAMSAIKKDRRVAVGPDASFCFESFETMWHQVHEMLFIEGGGEAQIPGELEAYNPLIPNGRELVATFMIEIDNPERRSRVLAGLGGIEECLALRVGDATIAGVAEEDIDRTTAEGKASAVHFVHFPCIDAQMDAFRAADAEISIAITHDNYSHMAVLSGAVRAALAADFA
ncbi:MAG: DUF3501 family protein [Alphaproteobacteria bacterium]|nr:hypothetical protein [Rhodospirillaceae bacterium]MDP6485555.1 DUF3501 family protein [Alphaproteobacteria bacterium]MDP6660589.1 DUF3501 family protein [Alphaproteobacteria bacterium]MDP6780829.1 DUF3501 family protein [Alphaproteobacteria bacterium]MDP7044533.1 DUF3501 family protein [Alphaproteobacteria bacterium]